MNDRSMSEGEYQAAYADPLAPVPETLFEAAGFWRTRDGRTLRIAEMATDHLRHAIRLFSLGGWAEEPKIRELREELARR